MKAVIVRREIYLERNFRNYIYTKYGKGEKRPSGLFGKAFVKVNKLIRHSGHGLRVVG